jgi:broad specificity phosphatase PhoE
LFNMTHVTLIHAGPTPWDEEDRMAGGQTLPLADDALAKIAELAKQIAPPVTAIYYCKRNEASHEAARMLGGVFNLRPRDNEGLQGFELGLWEGLTRSELRRRFPSVFPQWEERPLSVNPPDGETLPEAIDRIHAAVVKIVKRNRGGSIVLVMRPLALQIALGVLRHESAETIAAHLHNTAAMETIALGDAELHLLLS